MQVLCYLKKLIKKTVDIPITATDRKATYSAKFHIDGLSCFIVVQQQFVPLSPSSAAQHSYICYTVNTTGNSRVVEVGNWVQ